MYNLTEGQLIDCSKHIKVQHKRFDTVLSEKTLFETTDSVKELCEKVKEYLAQGRHYEGGLHSYLVSQGVKLPTRKSTLSKKNFEVPPIIIQEGLPPRIAPITFEMPKIKPTPNMGMLPDAEKELKEAQALFAAAHPLNTSVVEGNGIVVNEGTSLTLTNHTTVEPTTTISDPNLGG